MGGTNQGASTANEPAAAEPPPAPDPVNAEYARRATDLVLDALKNQRENPDPKLLDELGWTPDQYRRFIDRWEKARRMAASGDQAAEKEFDESLRSLGIRPPQANRSRSLDNRSDELENLRDAGTRVPPPPQFREAFEAFRRTVNQP